MVMNEYIDELEWVHWSLSEKCSQLENLPRISGVLLLFLLFHTGRIMYFYFFTITCIILQIILRSLWSTSSASSPLVLNNGDDRFVHTQSTILQHELLEKRYIKQPSRFGDARFLLCSQSSMLQHELLEKRYLYTTNIWFCKLAQSLQAGWCCALKGLLTWAQFHKACKHKILLSTDKSCLAELGYQPTLHKVNIVSAGTPLTSC